MIPTEPNLAKLRLADIALAAAVVLGLASFILVFVGVLKSFGVWPLVT
jgi:hypothetical protein